VARKHYLAQINAAKKCSNFRVFPEAEIRVNQGFLKFFLTQLPHPGKEKDPKRHKKVSVKH